MEFGAERHVDPVTTLFSGAPDGKVGASQHAISSSVSMTQLFKTGALATVTASAAREATNGLATLYAPAYTSSLGVELRQPLLRHRAIDPARAALQITALDHDRSSADLAREVIGTVADVEKAYWALVAARREREVRQATLALAEQQRHDTEIRIEARTIAPADLAEASAEVERRRGDLLRAQEQASRAERALKVLMFDEGSTTWGTTLEPADDPEAAPRPIDVEAAVAQALDRRPELAELVSEIKQRDVHVSAARDDLKPTVDLFVSYTARGLSGSQNDRMLAVPGMTPSVPSSLSGSMGTSWEALMNGRFSNAAAGLSIGVPIGNNRARGDHAAAVAERKQAAIKLEKQRVRIEQEVRDAAFAAESAARRIEAAASGLRAAEAQLRAEQDRFAAGATTSFFVLTRQTELASAQLAQIAAVTDYRTALTELARATGATRIGD
jgi:HAE1 family hydrophobic/amphiphilic exporter-1